MATLGTLGRAGDVELCSLEVLGTEKVPDALTLMHDKPAHAWTIEELAREVGLSRLALPDRSIHFVGQPPMHYLTGGACRWRQDCYQAGARASR